MGKETDSVGGLRHTNENDKPRPTTEYNKQSSLRNLTGSMRTITDRSLRHETDQLNLGNESEKRACVSPFPVNYLSGTVHKYVVSFFFGIFFAYFILTLDTSFVVQ